MSITIGLDIGGTSVHALALDTNNTITARANYPTNSTQGIEAFLDATQQCINTLKAESGKDLRAIGIGCTGPVDYQSGIIANPYTLPGLEGHSISALLAERIRVPTFIDNDANTAHLGEIHTHPNAPSNTVLLTFGTGVGVSIRIDGELFRTPGGIHPEMGHIPISIHHNPPCYCGRTNCAENILSGNAINKYAKHLADTTAEHLLTTQDGRPFEEDLVIALTDVIVTFTTIFHAQTVFIGGGMQDFFEHHLIEKTQRRLNALLPIYGKATIEGCRAKENAGALGAALLARRGRSIT
jgi:glucokinase